MLRWAKVLFCYTDQKFIASKKDSDSNPSKKHSQILPNLDRTILFFAVITLRNGTKNQLMHKYSSSLRIVNPPEVSYVPV